MRCEYAEEPGKDDGIGGVQGRLFWWLFPQKNYETVLQLTILGNKNSYVLGREQVYLQ